MANWQGPPSADHDDGYTTTNYYQSRNSRDEKTLLRGDSGGALNELVEQEEVCQYRLSMHACMHLS